MSYAKELQAATDAYWSTHSRREEAFAYYTMLLFGVRDGYAPSGRVRTAMARVLRLLALRIERRF